MSSTSQSNQESSSSSFSDTEVIDTQENAILRGLSGYAESLARQMQSWADGVFSNTSRITDQAVGNFFNVSSRMLGLSNTLTDQYNNIFAPQNAQLAREANEYNSIARQRVNMGMAGATQRQAGDAALRSSEEALRSYGINPADGRYAALNKAAAVQNAANTAGAMNLERERTAQVGRDLRRDAIQVGATLPAAIANVTNTAIQANTGASNATLANANTGANLNRVANDYLRTAMDLKLPPTGQKSRSQSQGKGQSTGMSASPQSSGGGGGGGSRGSGGGGGGGGQRSYGGGSGQSWMPQHGGGGSNMTLAGYRGGQGGSRVFSTPEWWRDSASQTASNDYWNDYDTSWPLEGVDADQWTQQDDGSWYTAEDGGFASVSDHQATDAYNDYGGQYDNWGFDSYDFGQNGWDDTYGGGGDYDTYGNIDYGDSYYDGSWGNLGYDTSANQVDTGWENTYDTPVDTDWSGGNAGWDSYGYGGGDSGSDWSSGGTSYDTTSYDSDFYAGDWSQSGDEFSYDDYGGVFAKGGPVQGKRPMPQRRPMPSPGGGRVPPRMSPSGGQRVDDIPAVTPNGPARLNADEFVIPKDVALWKGQEFFQNLIDQSRKKRMTAPAPGGQPSPQPMV